MAEKTSKGGFGAMDEKQREILVEKARQAAQERGVTPEEVRERGQSALEKGRERMEEIHQQREEGNR